MFTGSPEGESGIVHNTKHIPGACLVPLLGIELTVFRADRLSTPEIRQPPSRLPREPALEIMQGEHDLSKFCLQDEDGPGTDVEGVQAAPNCFASTRYGRRHTIDSSGVWGHVWEEKVARVSGVVGMQGEGVASGTGRMATPLANRKRGQGEERERGAIHEGVEHADGGHTEGVVPVGCEEPHRSVTRGSVSEWLSPATAAARQEAGAAVEFMERTDRHDSPGVRRVMMAKGEKEAVQGRTHVDATSPRPAARTSDNSGKQQATPSRARVWNSLEDDDHFRGNNVFFPVTGFAPSGDGAQSVSEAVGEEGSKVWTEDYFGPSQATFATLSPTGYSSETGNDRGDVGDDRQELGGGAFVGAITSGVTAETQSALWKQGQSQVEVDHVRPEEFQPGDRVDRGHLSGLEGADSRAKFDETRHANTGDRSVSTIAVSDALGRSQQQHRQREGYQRGTSGTAAPMMFQAELEMTSPPRLAVRRTSSPTGNQQRARLSSPSPRTSSKRDENSKPPFPKLPYSKEGLIAEEFAGDRESCSSSDRHRSGSSGWKGSTCFPSPRHGLQAANTVPEAFVCADESVAKDQEHSHRGIRRAKDGAVERLQRSALDQLVGGVDGFCDGSMVARATAMDEGEPMASVGAVDAPTSLAEGQGYNNEVGSGCQCAFLKARHRLTSPSEHLPSYVMRRIA